MKGIKLYQIIFALSILSIISCVKDPQDIPGDMTQDPQFGITGAFGSTSLFIQPSVDDWTVQPFVEEGSNTLRYTALFSKLGCVTDCAPSLELGFYRTLNPSGNHQTDFLQTIDKGIKSYVKSDAERDSFEILLSTHPALFMTSNSAWFSPTDSVTSYLPTFESTTGFEEVLHVCFQSFAYTGCYYNQCIYFDPATMVPCLAYLEPKLINNNYISLTVRPQGTPPFLIEWSNIDAPAGFNIDPYASTIILPVFDSSFVYATVKVTDALGNITALSQTVHIRDNNLDPCYFPIELSSQQITSAVPADFADLAEITYTDETGQVWSSIHGAQSQNSNLTISDVEYFGLSPAAQDTYKVRLSFAVTLYNRDTGEQRNLIVQEAVIPLSHH